MKKTLFLGFFLLLTVSVVWAAEPPPRTVFVDGNAAEDVYYEFGDDTIGGASGGSSFSEFFGESYCEADGWANANGIGIGQINASSLSATVDSWGSVNSNTLTQDTWRSEGNLSGLAFQSSWAEIGNNQNGAYGMGYTDGQYEGERERFGDINIWGSAVAGGYTDISMSSDTTWKQSNFYLSGSSNTMMDLNDWGGFGSVSVLGIGAAGSVSTMGNTDSGPYAGAIANGGAGYGEVFGYRELSGSLNIQGQTRVEITDTYSTANSNVHSHSELVGGICGDGPCPNQQ
ncbi:MAG: hypothetical protein JW740_02270 [Candidatus Zambryskibacteria bacterium]|nr:hypothetical protein [Candidatus Zambryskibacteria bacterium]